MKTRYSNDAKKSYQLSIVEVIILIIVGYSEQMDSSNIELEVWFFCVYVLINKKTLSIKKISLFI